MQAPLESKRGKLWIPESIRGLKTIYKTLAHEVGRRLPFSGLVLILSDAFVTLRLTTYPTRASIQ